MLDAQQQDQLNQDLGLGGRMSERSHSRLLNHDGTFNVRRSTLGPFHPYNAYHTLLSMPLPRLLALVALAYFGANLLFATRSLRLWSWRRGRTCRGRRSTRYWTRWLRRDQRRVSASETVQLAVSDPE